MILETFEILENYHNFRKYKVFPYFSIPALCGLPIGNKWVPRFRLEIYRFFVYFREYLPVNQVFDDVVLLGVSLVLLDSVGN